MRCLLLLACPCSRPRRDVGPFRTRFEGYYTSSGELQPARWNAAQIRRILARTEARALATVLGSATPATDNRSVAPAPTQPTALIDIHLVVNRQREGPFSKSQVKAMLDAGTLSLETVFWRDSIAVGGGVAQ
jgi:GYF domain 2